MLLWVSQIIGIAMTIIPFKFSIIYGTAAISDVYMYYYVPVVMGMGTIIARFFFGWLASQGIRAFTVNKLLQLGTIATSLQLAYTPNDNQGLVLFALFTYSCFNSHFPLVALRTVALLGDYQHHINFGVQCFAVGIGYCLGGFAGGYVYDETNQSFFWLFLSCTISFAVALVYDELVFPHESFLFYYISFFSG